MPHVIVKLWPGKPEEKKTELSDKISDVIMNVLNYGEESVSVSIEEIKPEEWQEKVYKTDILNGRGKLYKKPGYKY